ncbi:MAG TPA: cell division protein SepF [Candidatus Nanoarchaeia archaeon]|nr:cell division protein SepF [Candidatus Nanoarchaeia archaeon]
MGIFSKLKETFSGKPVEQNEEDYLELDSSHDDRKSKVVVRPFVLQDFADIKGVLDATREGYTISLINIKPLKEKDMAELKRAVQKLKKTAEAIEGDIAGFGDDWLVLAPNFAQIYRSKPGPQNSPQNAQQPQPSQGSVAQVSDEEI